MRHCAQAAIAASLVLGLSGSASAAIAGCSDFAAANGTTTFPGTFVGTVGTGAGQVCQIGNIASNNVSASGTFVNNTQSTSIYSFFWGGGFLTVQEKLGNNGLGKAVDVYFDALSSAASTSPSSTLGSVAIPFQSGPTSYFTLLDNVNLVSGYYAIQNTLSVNAEDPTYQINFSRTGVVPEPETLALAALPFAWLALARRKRRRGAKALSVF